MDSNFLEVIPDSRVGLGSKCGADPRAIRSPVLPTQGVSTWYVEPGKKARGQSTLAFVGKHSQLVVESL